MRLAVLAAIVSAGTIPLLAPEGTLAQTAAPPLAESATWDYLRDNLLGDTALETGLAPFEVEAPSRAHDAATVPVVIRQTDAAAAIRAVTVVVDENPAPVAAEIAFGPRMGAIDFELRLRVDNYSNVRVIAETDAGSYMTGRFVKASGGCSAPASRDPAQALAEAGEMRLRDFGEGARAMSGERREAQLMIRHPNYSGLQRDQITHLFIPANFIDHLEVWQGDEMLFTVEGGISISENPVFRFGYLDNGAADFRVRATDTGGNLFERTLPKVPAS
jgi:sulfur-oxidizing protein SoxY